MKTQINKALEVLKEGGVILYPTDTIWGLGCDPKNESAIKKIKAIKKRSEGKNFIILVDSERLLNRYVKEIPEVCYDLIDYANRPLTIVYPQGQHVSKLVMAEDNSIAIRLTKNEFCKKLIQQFKSGIVSTSANISGQDSPKKFSDIPEDILKQVDYVVDLPLSNPNTEPSQIIKISHKSEVTIIRK
ncbi:MAG: L-threonylcarbamoyladenylate synthase [Putridiphycobacter sp.]